MNMLECFKSKRCIISKTSIQFIYLSNKTIYCLENIISVKSNNIKNENRKNNQRNSNENENISNRLIIELKPQVKTEISVESPQTLQNPDKESLKAIIKEHSPEKSKPKNHSKKKCFTEKKKSKKSKNKLKSISKTSKKSRYRVGQWNEETPSKPNKNLKNLMKNIEIGKSLMSEEDSIQIQLSARKNSLPEPRYQDRRSHFDFNRISYARRQSENILFSSTDQLKQSVPFGHPRQYPLPKSNDSHQGPSFQPCNHGFSKDNSQNQAVNQFHFQHLGYQRNLPTNKKHSFNKFEKNNKHSKKSFQKQLSMEYSHIRNQNGFQQRNLRSGSWQIHNQDQINSFRNQNQNEHQRFQLNQKLFQNANFQIPKGRKMENRMRTYSLFTPNQTQDNLPLDRNINQGSFKGNQKAKIKVNNLKENNQKVSSNGGNIARLEQKIEDNQTFSMAAQNHKIKKINFESPKKMNKNRILNQDMFESIQNAKKLLNGSHKKPEKTNNGRFELGQIVRKLSGKFDNTKFQTEFDSNQEDYKMDVKLNKSAERLIDSLESKDLFAKTDKIKIKKIELIKNSDFSNKKGNHVENLRRSLENMKFYLKKVQSVEPKSFNRLSNLDISVMEMLRHSFDKNSLKIKKQSRYSFGQGKKSKSQEHISDPLKVKDLTSPSAEQTVLSLVKLMENYISNDEDVKPKFEQQSSENKAQNFQSEEGPIFKANICKPINNRYTSLQESQSNINQILNPGETVTLKQTTSSLGLSDLAETSVNKSQAKKPQSEESERQLKIVSAHLKGDLDKYSRLAPSFLNLDHPPEILQGDLAEENGFGIWDGKLISGLRKSDSTTDSLSEPRSQVSNN